jgi:uncharacterized protein YqgC (DUF456 family)
MMIYLLLALFVLLNTLSLGLVLIGLPGNWMMVIFTWALALWQWDQHLFGLPVLIAIIILAGFGELMEFLAGAVVVRKVGGTRRAAVGAILGALVFGIVGTMLIPIPIFGSIIGACMGAFLGAWFFEFSGGKAMNESIRSGLGAGLGHFIGLNMKLIAGTIIWITVTIAAFRP